MKLAKKLTDLIGNTPLLELGAYSAAQGLETPVIAKLEYFNPLSSVKDRAGFEMIEDAERRGVLKEGSVIIEPTSGSMGIALAYVGLTKGYRVIIVMPETMTVERRKLLLALGAELVLTEGPTMAAAIKRAEELQKEIEGAVILGQFDNPANAAAHEKTTAQEIWRDLDGRVDAFVGGVGTGGTITGVSAGLKAHDPSVRIVAVEPAGSPVLSGGTPGVHKLQGLGAGFVPKVLNTSAYDEIMTVTDEQAYAVCRLLARTEGLLVGVSSGAALYAATELARRSDYQGKTIVALLPDTGERYLSTELFG